MTKELDVVTLVYNSSHCLPRFLKGLKLGGYEEYHLTVIDGKSSDEEKRKMLEILNEFDIPFTWIPLPENYFETKKVNNIPAYHVSVNVGLRFVQGPYVLLMNPDCFGDKEPGWLNRAMDFMKKLEADEDHKVGVVGATLFHHDGTVDHMGGAMINNGKTPNHIGRGMPNPGYGNDVLKVHWNTGAWHLTTKALLEDLAYHRCDGTYGSDVLLGTDALDKGYTNFCLPVQLYHNEHESSDAAFYQENYTKKKRSY